MAPVPSLDITWFCLTAAVVALAAAAAVGALAVTLHRRVADLAADLAGVTAEDRPACPDRLRIDRLEDFARGSNGDRPPGRHGPAPPGRRRVPEPSQLLGAPPEGRW